MIYTADEPEAARYTKDNKVVKDHHYYKGEGFLWNKKAAMNKKYYPYFHK